MVNKKSDYNGKRKVRFVIMVGSKAEMAVSIHGSMGPFDNSQENWLSYIERLQQYFTANKDNSIKWEWYWR